MTPDLFTPGAELPALHVPSISRKTLALFAGASGDHQPSHLDIDAARAKGREDVIAHGMLIMAYLARVLTDTVPQERIREFKTRFVAVTPVHAAPVCRATVRTVESGTATLELVAELENGLVVARGEAVVEIG